MNNKDMEIRTTEEIQEWKQQPIESDNGLNWVRTSQIKERINHIRDVIRECSFEDDFGEQCFKYCDLNNMFKILETELNKQD